MARWYKTTVTRKGQVTIPIEIRRAMGLKEGDSIAFVRDGESVRLDRWISVVEQTAGIGRTEGPPLSAEELRAAAEQAIAEDVMERLSR